MSAELKNNKLTLSELLIVKISKEHADKLKAVSLETGLNKSMIVRLLINKLSKGKLSQIIVED